MKIAVFSAKKYTKTFFERANREFGHELTFFKWPLSRDLGAAAAGYPAVCAFVNDRCDRDMLQALSQGGTRLLALRSAGFNHVDLAAAKEFGITVVRVPGYSPYAVAEHAVALMLSLNRKIHRAVSRVRESNFELEGLLGFDFHGQTVGIVGTGKIGAVMARILHGFGCRLLGYDVHPNPACTQWGLEYVDLPTLYAQSDIVTLHCPLNQDTHHLIDRKAIEQMKEGMMLINTSRGALIDSRAAIEGLKSGKIGYLGLDVYEEEENLFFSDHSDQILQDDTFARLLTFPNVIVTGHQAFFTREALDQIARTTLQNVRDIEETGRSANEVEVEKK